MKCSKEKVHGDKGRISATAFKCNFEYPNPSSKLSFEASTGIRGNFFCIKQFSSGRNSKLRNEISSALIASLLLELNESDQFFKAPYLSSDAVEEIAYTYFSFR